jgi:hypothetical protein
LRRHDDKGTVFAERRSSIVHIGIQGTVLWCWEAGSAIGKTELSYPFYRVLRFNESNGSLFLPNGSVKETEWFDMGDQTARFQRSNSSVSWIEGFGQMDRSIRFNIPNSSVQRIELFGSVDRRVRSDLSSGSVFLPNGSVQGIKLFGSVDRRIARTIVFLVGMVSMLMGRTALAQADYDTDFNLQIVNGNVTQKCYHDECYEGEPLVQQCSLCARSICMKAQYNYCCSEKWDMGCVAATQGVSYCKQCSLKSSLGSTAYGYVGARGLVRDSGGNPIWCRYDERMDCAEALTVADPTGLEVLSSAKYKERWKQDAGAPYVLCRKKGGDIAEQSDFGFGYKTGFYIPNDLGKSNQYICKPDKKVSSGDTMYGSQYNYQQYDFLDCNPHNIESLYAPIQGALMESVNRNGQDTWNRTDENGYFTVAYGNYEDIFLPPAMFVAMGGPWVSSAADFFGSTPIDNACQRESAVDCGSRRGGRLQDPDHHVLRPKRRGSSRGMGR